MQENVLGIFYSLLIPLMDLCMFNVHYNLKFAYNFAYMLFSMADVRVTVIISTVCFPCLKIIYQFHPNNLVFLFYHNFPIDECEK